MGRNLTLEVQKLRLEEEEEVDEGKGFHAPTALALLSLLNIHNRGLFLANSPHVGHLARNRSA